MATQNVLLFRGGKWIEVDVAPFSDPALTAGQKLFAAAAVVSTGSVAAAEKILYERIFGANNLGWVSGK
jgi:hypothetical protein